MNKGWIDRLLGLKADEPSATHAPQGQLRDPSLDERVSLYLRAAHGKHDFGNEAFSDARNRILDAMAGDIAEKLGFNGADQAAMHLPRGANPSTLAARVLRASRPPIRRSGIFNLQWPTLSAWRWSGLGAAVTATVVIAVFGFQFWQAQLRLDQSFMPKPRMVKTIPIRQGTAKIAMVTIEDRSVLSEGARRPRGPLSEKVAPEQPEQGRFSVPVAASPTPSPAPSLPHAGRLASGPPTPAATLAPSLPSADFRPDPYGTTAPAESRYLDIDIPTALLRNAINSISAHRFERSELLNYLHEQNDAFNNQAHILIDSALAESLSAKPDERNSIQVRVYDLDDPRAANIRSKIKMLQVDARFILLTLKP
jgi:hypothetical protein